MVQVRLLLLAALSQEHILYIGPPGTAKSELGRRLSRLCAGTFFERLLTRFSVPEVALCQVTCQSHSDASSLIMIDRAANSKSFCTASLRVYCFPSTCCQCMALYHWAFGMLYLDSYASCSFGRDICKLEKRFTLSL